MAYSKLLAELDQVDPGPFEEPEHLLAPGPATFEPCENCQKQVQGASWHIDPATGEYACEHQEPAPVVHGQYYV